MTPNQDALIQLRQERAANLAAAMAMTRAGGRPAIVSESTPDFQFNQEYLKRTFSETTK